MKILVIILCAVILLNKINYAQISQGGLPLSFNYNLKNEIDRLVLQPKNLRNVMYEEAKYPKDGQIPFIGYSIITDISPDNSGTWTILPEGGKLWQLQIKSPGALALGLYYDHFHLPIGGKLFVFNEDKSKVIGAFTWENNDPSGLFANEMINGDIINIEYYEPENVAAELNIHINEVAYFYRGIVTNKNPNWTEPSEACEININCTPVGNNWQDEKKGVARILVKLGTNYGFCTGSLINNTSQNCIPYFLTAYHCYEGATTENLNQWVFYFNYESASCLTPNTEPSSNTLVGSSLKSYGNSSGGSDFALLMLNQYLPNNYNAYMNGWNRASTFNGPGVGIHHPAGSVKKISTFSSASIGTYSTSSTGCAANAHLKLVWVTNANGLGVTEPGSSGSPLFDVNGNIVGTLTGGSSYCNALSNPDYYGRLYYHWDLNSGGVSSQLKSWLDPINSNVQSLNGRYCNSVSNTLLCDTALPISFSNIECNYTYYNSDIVAPYDSGSVSGQNAFLDREKAMRYSASVGNTISDVFVMYGFRRGNEGDTYVKLYSDNAGMPGVLLGNSSVIAKSDINTSNQGVNYFNGYHFTNPVSVGTNFFVSVVLPSSFASGTNELVILSSNNSCPSNTNSAFERWANNTWHKFSDVHFSNCDWAIFPVICPTLGIEENEILKVKVFPNPTWNQLFLVLPYENNEKVEVSIYDIYGKLCKNLFVNAYKNQFVSIELNDLNDGVYILKGESRSGNFIEKIIVNK